MAQNDNVSTVSSGSVIIPGSTPPPSDDQKTLGGLTDAFLCEIQLLDLLGQVVGTLATEMKDDSDLLRIMNQAKIDQLTLDNAAIQAELRKDKPDANVLAGLNNTYTQHNSEWEVKISPVQAGIESRNTVSSNLSQIETQLLQQMQPVTNIFINQ